MILHELNKYYERKAETENSDLPPLGFERKEIHFTIVLNDQGEFFDVEDNREIEGTRKKAKSFLVPKGGNRTANIAANLLWDGIDYALGIKKISEPPPGKTKDPHEKRGKERLEQQHQAFVQKIKSFVPDSMQDGGIQATIKFLESQDFEKLLEHPIWEEIFKSNSNISFRIKDELQLVCQSNTVREQIKKAQPSSSDNSEGFCLITGEKDEIERLHPAIKGVKGAQTSGAKIVSFNLPAFCSHGKEQGANAPVGKRAAFAYTTALNYLLRKDSGQKLIIGDASTVFWAEQSGHRMETLLEEMFGKTSTDDPDRGVRAVKALYKAPKTGAIPLEEDSTRFFVLGLSPNASRISVRFWQATTIKTLAHNIIMHFEDIEICHAPFENDHLSLSELLLSTATQGEQKNIPPNLAGHTMKSILEGIPYPRTLLSAVLTRTRMEQAKKDQKENVSHPRAALIKACLNRHCRIYSSHEKEITVSLDEANHNIGYLLGRLFATLEKTQKEAQEEASHGLNATIRDRFYGSASTRPRSVFSSLLKLQKHHVSKLENRNRGRAINLEKLIGGIIDDVQDFPTVLNLEDQGRFAIGYYHQRQNFFKKSDNSEEKGE